MKGIKASKQQREIDEQLLNPAVRIQNLKTNSIILGHELFVTKKIKITKNHNQ